MGFIKKIRWLFFLLIASPLCGVSDQLSLPKGLLVSSGLNPHFIAKFALFVAILLLWTIACGQVLKKVFHLPVIVGQILGGIALGPSWVDIAGRAFFSEPLHMIEEISGKVYAIASSDLFVFAVLLISSALTVSYLLWIAGHETDLQDIIKVGVTAVSAGVFGAVFPIVMIGAYTYYYLGDDFSLARSIALGLIFAATSVSIPIAMLFSHNKMHLKSSKATLGAAIIDDILAVILLSVFFIGLQSGTFGAVEGFIQPEHSSTLSEAIVYLLVSFAVIFCTGFWFIPPFIEWLRTVRYTYLTASMANGIMLLYFAFAELIGGLAGITGAYFAGLFHRMGDSRHQAEKTISPFVNAFLLPLFLGSIGLQINIRFLSWHEWSIVFVLLIIAIISKMVGCYMAAFLSSISGRRKAEHRWNMGESYLFGSSMVARGEVGLVIASILNGSRVITPEQYVIAVVTIILTTIASPIMLVIGFSRIRVAARTGTKDFTLRMGPFYAIGTTQLFNIIVGQVEASGLYKTSIRFSEGRKIVNLEGQNLRLILCPSEGIILKGDRQHIEDIINMVKGAISKDMQGFSAP